MSELGILSRDEHALLSSVEVGDLIAWLDANRVTIATPTVRGTGGRSIHFADGAWQAQAWDGQPFYDFTLNEKHPTLAAALKALVDHDLSRMRG